MQEQRGGLRMPADLPPAVTIKSGPASPAPAAKVINHGDAPSYSGGGPARYPQGYPSYQEWKDWHINPVQHGPSQLVRPPSFVPSQASYDELGRCVSDGVGVSVDSGQRAPWIALEDGQSVAAWYTALSSREGSGRSTPLVDEPGPSTRAKGRSSPVIIDLTLDDDDDEDNAATATSGIPAEAHNVTQEPNVLSTLPLNPVRVHPNEWFIRRALASSAKASPIAPPTSKPPGSIGAMLKIDPQQNRVAEPQYVLGLNNKGHQILRERLGWEGGGLGRPPGWVPPQEQSSASPDTDTQADTSKGASDTGQVITVSDAVSDESDTNSDEVSGSEVEIDLDLPRHVGPSGPGRTAPIATTLKLDRLGLGHRNARDLRSKKNPKPGADTGQPRSAAKVTHTHEEILRAQRRARYLGGAARRAAAVAEGREPGKKAKVRWKEREKRDRDERRRMIAALNA